MSEMNRGHATGWRVTPLGDGWSWSAYGPNGGQGGWKPTKAEAVVVAQAAESALFPCVLEQFRNEMGIA